MADRTDDWTAWLDRHGPALIACARQWAGGHVDAEDIVQDGFVRFWRSRSRARDSAAYLYVCVKSAALDWHRRRARRSKRQEMAVRQNNRHDESMFDTRALEHREAQAAIEAALTELPLPQRAVLIMKLWGGLTFEQIAEVMDVPASTAASRYRYALEALRKGLDEEALQ